MAIVPYLFVYSVVLNLLESHGWALRESLNLPLTASWLLVIGYWAWAAWRPSEAPVQAPPLVPDPDPSLDGSAG